MIQDLGNRIRLSQDIRVCCWRGLEGSFRDKIVHELRRLFWTSPGHHMSDILWLHLKAYNDL